MAAAIGSRANVDKNNESRGGSKRWSGKGPAPARHIPWPEVFKHHISVVEGHYKMLDMIRKHTVEGTSNWNTIMACLNRAQMALEDSKTASRNFIEPIGGRENVPIGSSSVSMYPGYSPADHQYGDAAQAAGIALSKARQEGRDVEMTEDGPEYRLGQGNSGRRGRATPASGANGFKVYESALPHRKSASGTNAVPVAAKQKNGEANSKPMFVFDSNPTPVNAPAASSQPTKRSGSPMVDEDHPSAETNGAKKAKTKHKSDDANGEEVEKDDITDRVEARLKEKEEKRRRKKEEKKRKRESGASADDAEAAVMDAEPEEVAETKAEKPKKKKSKRAKEDDVATEEAEAAAEEKPKKKKKSDKKKDKK